MIKSYLKKFIFLLIALSFSGYSYGQFLNESFDGATYPPTGWTEIVITNTNTAPLTGLWERVTTGTDPICTTHSGAGMLKYNTWDYVAATSGLLISPVVDLTAITPTTIFEFWMYRDNGNATAIDSLSFYINTTASITGATLLGNYNRIRSLSPIETGADGWYKYQVLIPAGFNTATNYLILKGYSGYGNNLFVDDISIKNPVVADAAPTTMTFTGTTINSTTVGWTDNSTNENSFKVYMSTNPTSGFVQVGTEVASTTSAGIGTTYSKTITGLLDNTTYYYKVSAVTDLESAYLTGNVTTVAGTISGVKTIGTTGDYPSLTAAFAAINTNGLASSVELSLQADYVSTVETFPITPSPIATATETIKVYPAAPGLSITSSNAIGTINFDGASYITFDGRINGVGSAALVIANTALTAYTVNFINGSAHNSLKSCSIQGVDTVASSGVVVFSTSNNGIGNSYNTIDSCEIRDGASTPLNAIYAYGTAGAENKNITISNSNIYNFYFNYPISKSPIGIGIFGGNSAWSIINNSFYQTSPRNPAASIGYNIIYIGAGDNHTISGNNIGGSAPMCGGTPFTLNGLTLANSIYAIRIAASAGVNPNSIQGNTIANISLQSYSTTAGSIRFVGVLSSAGTSNIGTVVGNTIGSNTVTGSILYTNGNSTNTSLIGGVYLSVGTGNIQNNTIGGITINATTTSTSAISFYGIFSGGTMANIISNNVIGSNTLANSIQTVAATSTPIQMAGIYTNIGSGTATYNNNIIANIVNNNTPTSGYVLGLRNAGTVVTSITNNNIHDLSSATNNVSNTNLPSLIGISSSNSGANLVISRNSIFNLSNTAPTAAVAVIGIYRSGTGAINGKIEKNLIYNLSANTTSTSAKIYGIMANGGSSSFSNNMIRLGYKADGSDLTNGLKINGIFDVALTNNYYHNTVYIGGSNVVGVDTTYAFNSLASTGTRNFQNNIFVTTRTNTSGTGKYFAVSVSGTTVNPAGLNLNNNIYYVSGTGGVFGYFNGAEVTDFATWKTNTGMDANSINADPLLVAPTAVIPNLHLTVGSPAESAGTPIASVVDDIDGDIRANNTPSDIGADAGIYDVLLPSATFVPANASINIAVGTTVEVTFNEMVRKVDNTYLDNSNIASVISFVKVSDNSSVAYTATWDAATKKIVATPSAALAAGATYKFSVSGLEDYSNNVLTGPDSTRFTTLASSDATLSDLTTGGTTVTGFVSGTYVYNVILPSGTTVVPTVTAVTTDANATRVITAATSLPGSTIIVVTAQNLTTQLTYTINYTVAAANDASLSDLKVNGTTVTGFAPTTYSYNVALPFGTVTVPTVLGIASDANATVTYTHAAALPGVDSVKVTAQDGVTKLLYLVHFSITPAATDASLSDLKVSGTTVTGFAPTTYSYNVVLPAGTTAVPPVTAVATDANATITYVHAAALPGVDSVKVTAQDGVTKLLYLVHFTVAIQTYAVTFSVVGTNGTLAATVDAAAITSPTDVNVGKTVVFTATPATNYSVKEWKLNGTVVTGNLTNTYSIVNLAATSDVTVEFKLNVGVNEVNENFVSIYPNPANDVVNVKMNNTINKIEIVNMNGQVIAESVINNNEGSINTSTIANGMYFLRIETSNGITMNKIQIVK
jgi:hypothetical protein